MGGANERGETDGKFEGESRDGGGIEKGRGGQWVVPAYISTSLYLSLRVCVFSFSPGCREPIFEKTESPNTFACFSYPLQPLWALWATYHLCFSSAV